MGVCVCTVSCGMAWIFVFRGGSVFVLECWGAEGGDLAGGSLTL